MVPSSRSAASSPCTAWPRAGCIPTCPTIRKGRGVCRQVQTLSGWSPKAAFGWQRNHFDRLIHFLFGVCFTPALLQLARHAWPALRLGQAFTLTVMTVMCASLVYEWFEWAIALALSPDAAEAYNGQQGDMWDAHADMLMATLGSLLVWPLIRRSAQQ